MRKLIIATLSLCCQFTFAEYVIIDKIVYNVNFDDLTATVVNFQTSTSTPCDVTIPESIKYKNDSYTVTGLSYYAFNYDAYSDYKATSMLFGSDIASYGLNNAYKKEEEEMKYQYNYNEARANIEHLNLPNTLTTIKAGAFTGMKRLRTLLIPASVTTFTDLRIGNLLEGFQFVDGKFPRLESITIMGTPACTTGYYLDGTQQEINAALQNENGEFIYLSKMAHLVAEIDAHTNTSKLCPNLKSFSMPNAETTIREAIQNQTLCSQYNLDLENLCTEYNSKLQVNAYYDGTTLTYNPVSLSNDKGAMTSSYQSKKNELTKEFNALVNGKMEANLRKTNPEKFIQCYVIAHPEKQAMVDSIRLEYRCYSYIINEIIDAIDSKSISTESCREKIYSYRSDLFESRQEYDERYNHASSAEEFRKEIEVRESCMEQLKRFKYYLPNSSKVKLQGMSSANIGTPAGAFWDRIDVFRRNFYYDEAITAVLTTNEKAKAEYEKNGQYFANQKEFFEAYVSSNYKTILKNKKKAM